MTESLLQLVLPDVEDAEEYAPLVEELSRKTVTELKSAPQQLASQNQKLERQLEELALNNYRSFLRTSECITTTRAQLSQVRLFSSFSFFSLTLSAYRRRFTSTL